MIISNTNDLYHNFVGITDYHSGGTGLNKIYYNRVRESRVNGIASSNGASTSTIPSILNNLIIHKPTQDTGHGIVMQGSSKGMVAKDNIVVGEEITTATSVDFIQIQADGGDGTYVVDINNNLYFNAGASTYGFKYPTGAGVTRTTNFATWKTNLNRAEITGRDANSLFADPLFRSSSDYRLRAGSPAINAGVDVGLTTDYLGKPIRGLPDIGAYEFYGATGGMLMGLVGR